MCDFTFKAWKDWEPDDKNKPGLNLLVNLPMHEKYCKCIGRPYQKELLSALPNVTMTHKRVGAGKNKKDDDDESEETEEESSQSCCNEEKEGAGCNEVDQEEKANDEEANDEKSLNETIEEIMADTEDGDGGDVDLDVGDAFEAAE